MKSSYKVALGGVIAALCLVLMFLTAVFPLLNMALPLYAGMLITVVAVEVSCSWAFVTYAVVSVLAFFVTPDKEAWLFFTMFFGYYPVLKACFDKFRLRALCILCKLAVFNIAIVTAFYILTKVLGTFDFIEEFGFLKEWAVPVLIVVGNIIFLFYDYTLEIVVMCYKKWFRPTFLGKNK